MSAFKDLSKKHGAQTSSTTADNSGSALSSLREKHGIQSVYDRTDDTTSTVNTKKASIDYGSLKSNADYNQYSQYKASDWRRGDKYFAPVNESQITSGLIGAGNKVLKVLTPLAGNNDTRVKYQYMTPEEVSNYNYLHNNPKYGTDKADEYLKSIEAELNSRMTSDYQESMKEFTDKNFLNKVIGTVASSEYNALAGISSLKGDVGNVIESVVTGDDDYLDANSAGHLLTNTSNALTEGVADSIDSNVGKFLYTTGKSMVDSRINGALYGPFARINMGFNAYASRMKELQDMGANDLQLAVGSGIAGAFESLFEKFGIESAFKYKGIDGAKSYIKAVLKQSLSEGTEEAFTEISNAVADRIADAVGGVSDYRYFVNDYVAQGGNAEDADGAYVWQKFLDVGLSFLGGALSGGVFEAGRGAFEYSGNKTSGTNIIQNQQTENLKKLANEAGIKNADERIEEGNAATLGAIQNEVLKAAEDKANKKKATEDDVKDYVKTVKKVSEIHTPATGAIDSEGNVIKINDIDFENQIYKTDKGDKKFEEVRVTDSLSNVINLSEELTDNQRAVFLESYKGGNLGDYSTYFELAYQYGKSGYEDAAMRLVEEGHLTSAQMLNIYEAGLRDESSQVSKLNSRIKAVETRNKLFADTKLSSRVDDSVISYDGTDNTKIDYNSLTENQKQNVILSQAFAKAFNANVTLFDSKENNAVYNGMHDEETNTIYLDVYSTNTGTNGKSTTNAILTTMSHELTHWGKVNAPAAFEELKETILPVILKEKSLEIGGEVTRDMLSYVYSDEYRGLSNEKIEDELVARACENMLQNSEYAKEALGKLSDETKHTFIDKVKDFYKKIIAAIKDILGRADSNSKEYRMLSRNLSELEKAQKLWDEVIKESSENTLKRDAEIASIKIIDSDSEGWAYSKKDIDSFEEKLSKQIEDWKKGIMPSDRYFDFGGTPEVLLKLGVPGYPVVMNEDGILKFTTEYKDHSIAVDDVKLIPRQLHDPVMLFKGSIPGSYVFLVEIKDKKQRDVIVAVHIDELQGRLNVNKIASIYGKDNIEGYVSRQIKEGNYIELNNEKSRIWLTTKGLQLPSVVQVSPAEDIVLRNRENVKKKDEEYLEAVKTGNVKKAYRMVAQAAKASGYNIRAFHGSRNKFYKFDVSKRGAATRTEISKKWFFAADRETAKSYSPYYVLMSLAETASNPNMSASYRQSAKAIKDKSELYELYLKMENPLVIDAVNYDYSAHREKADAFMEFNEMAEKNGNDGIIVINALDNNLKTGARESTDYLFKNSFQAKLADAVTYDDDGNIIPLSQRFNSENDDIRYSLKDSEYLEKSTKKYGNVEKAAIEYFGTTKDFRVGGYILRDGTMLDFSGVHYLEGESPEYIAKWKKQNKNRLVDHEDIFEAFEISANDFPSDSRKEFINRGNIRMSPEAPGINIASEPTLDQYKVIEGLINEGPHKEEGFYVDIEDKNERVEKLSYSGNVNASKIVADIKYYYANGKVRDSSLSQFMYSLKDSSGNTLSEGQQEYFKDSKVRDENGNLKVMYHGSFDLTFTKFEKSDDGISYFFVDNEDVAKSYSATYDEIDPYTGEYIENSEDEDWDYEDEDWDSEGEDWDSEDEDIASGYEHKNGNYKVYLNLENPYIVDARGTTWDKIITSLSEDETIVQFSKFNALSREWFLENIKNDASNTIGNFEKLIRKLNSDFEEVSYNRQITPELTKAARYLDEVSKKWSSSNIKKKLFAKYLIKKYREASFNTTREIAKFAYDNGYDGVIINNVFDNGRYNDDVEAIGNIAVAFNSNQVKSIYNENPTSDPDIRYSLKDSETKPRSSQEQRDSGYKLSKAKFYSLYSKHKVGIGSSRDMISGQIESIKRNGFLSKEGYINVTPISDITEFNGIERYNELLEGERKGIYPKGRAEEYKKNYGEDFGKPVFSDIVQRKYAPKKGDVFLLVPKNYLDSEGLRIKDGFKPLDYEVLTVEHDYQNLYELYSKTYDSYQSEGTYYSLKDEAAELTTGDMIEIISQNPELKNKYKALYDAFFKEDSQRLDELERLRKTEGIRDLHMINDTKVEKYAKQILKDMNSNVNLKLFTDRLKTFYMLFGDEDVPIEDIQRMAQAMAKNIINNSLQADVNEETKRQITELRKELQGYNISLSDQQKRELRYTYGSDWMKQFIGKVKIRSTGTPLDNTWGELAGRYPYLFGSDTTESDEGVKLAEVLNGLYDKSAYTDAWNDRQREEYEKLLTNELLDGLYTVTNSAAEKYIQKERKLAEQYNRRLVALGLRKGRAGHITQEDIFADYAKALREQYDKYRKEYDELVMKRNLTQKILDKSTKLNVKLQKNDKDFHVPDVLKQPLLNLFNALQLQNSSNDRIAAEFANVSIALANVKSTEDALDDLSVYFDTDGYFREQIDSVVAEINDKDFKLSVAFQNEESFKLNRLSVNGLRAVNDFLSAINTASRNYDKALASSNKMRISPRGDASMDMLEKLGKKTTEGKGLLEKFRNFLGWENVTQIYAFDRFGEGGKETFKAIMEGQDKLAVNTKTIIDYAKEVFTGDQVDRWEKETHDFVRDDKTYTITTAQLMSLYCLSKRQAARQHLYKVLTSKGESVQGRGIVISAFEGKKSIQTRSEVIGVDEGSVKSLTDMLTPEQKEVADKLQKFMGTTCSDWGNFVTMKRFGIMQFTEDDYFPMAVDREAKDVEGKETPQGATIFRMLNASFTKSLDEKANGALILNSIFDVFTAHASDMAMYNAMGLPVLDTYRWLSYKRDEEGNPVSLKQRIREVYGEKGKQWILSYLEDMNGQRTRASSAEQIAGTFMRNYKTAAVAANIRVALMQPTAYLKALAVMDNKYLARSFFEMRPSQLKVAIAEMNSKAPLAMWKNELNMYDLNVGSSIEQKIRQTKEVKSVKGAIEKTMEWSMKLAEKADEVTWAKLYRACQLEVEEQGIEKGEAFDAAVNERFREVCFRTQVFDSINSRTELMRKKDMWTRIVTSFASEPSLSYSMVSSEVFNFLVEARTNKAEAFAKHAKPMARNLVAFLITELAVSMVAALPDVMRDDDNEEKFLKQYLNNAISNFGSDMVMLPYLRDVVSVIQGFDPSRPDEEIFASAVKAGKSLTDGKWNYRDIYNSLKFISQLSGIPFSNIVRDVKSAWNSIFGDAFGMKIE